MGLFKRISDLITPPPSQSDVVQRNTPPPSEGEQEAANRLGSEVRKLITADDMNSPEALLAITELKHIGSTIGLYIAASKMRFLLDAMPRVDGQIHHKDRGYVLAADFIYQHMTREIHGIESEGHEVGPNIFRSYCNELVACLVSGKNVRRAIEIPMLLVDSLLERALGSADHRDLYLSLVAQALDSCYTQSFAKYEADLRERARRRQDRKTDSGFASNHGIEDPSHMLDASTVEFLKEMCDRISEFMKLFSQCSAAPAPYHGPVPPDAPTAQRNLVFLQSVSPMAEKTGYYGLIAIVSQRIAAALSMAQPERQSEFWLRCGMANELQADRENKHLLFKLSKRRYKLAQEAYLKAGDTGRAAAAGQKLG